MRSLGRILACVIALGLVTACGGSGGSPATPPPPAPTPTPTPAPIGRIEFESATLAENSVVPVAPMFEIGQQAQSLSFRAIVTLDRDLAGVLVRAWVRTAERRCMGGGQAHLDFQTGVPKRVAPASMSHPGHSMPLCELPYSTTHVEFEVLDTESQLLSQSFPMAYQFVAAP